MFFFFVRQIEVRTWPVILHDVCFWWDSRYYTSNVYSVTKSTQGTTPENFSPLFHNKIPWIPISRLAILCSMHTNSRNGKLLEIVENRELSLCRNKNLLLNLYMLLSIYSIHVLLSAYAVVSVRYFISYIK